VRPHELAEGLERLEIRVNVAECRRMFAEVDADGSGAIDFLEFCQVASPAAASCALFSRGPVDVGRVVGKFGLRVLNLTQTAMQLGFRSSAAPSAGWFHG
jgi:hypothetical protein